MFVGFDCYIEQLARERHITVYLPDDYYQSHKRYPVMYIQDGQNAFFDDLSFDQVSWGFLDYVYNSGLEIILVAIPCNSEGDEKRTDEYGPWVISEELSYRETHQEGVILGGEGMAYTDWLVNDLKPYIDNRFRTDRDDTAIIGSSMGGVIATYAALAYPEVFRKSASLSSAYWFYYDEFEDLIVNSDLSAIEKFYFDHGEFEGCGDEEIDQEYFDSNEFMLNLLKDRISNLNFQYYEGASHNESEWRKRLPMIMDYLYFE